MSVPALGLWVADVLKKGVRADVVHSSVLVHVCVAITCSWKWYDENTAASEIGAGTSWTCLMRWCSGGVNSHNELVDS